MTPKNVFYIYVQYGEHKQAEGVRRLLQFHDENLKEFKKKVLVIDNKISNKNIFVEYDENCYKISGDNSNREFSAYDLGMEYVKNKFHAQDHDIVVVANDTFFTNYGDEYLRKFNKGSIRKALRQKGILGHVDAFPRSVTLSNLTFQKWIRTSFFVSDLRVVSQIGLLSIPWKDDVLFGGSVGNFFAETAPLSDNYKKYLRYWLFDFENKISEFPFEWHSKKKLDQSNLHDFQGKVKSILAEHYFSARAKNCNIPLVAI